MNKLSTTMDDNQQRTTKLQFITTDELWNKVLKYNYLFYHTFVHQ